MLTSKLEDLTPEPDATERADPLQARLQLRALLRQQISRIPRHRHSTDAVLAGVEAIPINFASVAVPPDHPGL